LATHACTHTSQNTLQEKQLNKLHKNYNKINYTISDLERFNLGLFTDDFRFVCVHEAIVCACIIHTKQ